jgi:clan AA aspartic protease
MITGFVTPDREAVIHMLVRNDSGREERIDAVIDTGFNGFLTLPLSIISSLGLSFAGTTHTALGDGSEVRMDVFEATVLWDNQERRVTVLATQGDALVGMAMLFGYRMTLEVDDGGTVVIEALS